MKKSRLLIMVCTCIFLTVNGTGAQSERVHMWVDNEGQVHFGDVPPARSKSEKLVRERGYTSQNNDKETTEFKRVRKTVTSPND